MSDFKAKSTKFDFGWGSAQGWGCLRRSPLPLALDLRGRFAAWRVGDREGRGMWKDRREVAIERREKGRTRERELRGQGMGGTGDDMEWSGEVSERRKRSKRDDRGYSPKL